MGKTQNQKDIVKFMNIESSVRKFHVISDTKTSWKPLQTFSLSNAVLLHKQCANVFVVLYIENCWCRVLFTRCQIWSIWKCTFHSHQWIITDHFKWFAPCVFKPSRHFECASVHIRQNGYKMYDHNTKSFYILSF